MKDVSKLVAKYEVSQARAQIRHENYIKQIGKVYKGRKAKRRNSFLNKLRFLLGIGLGRVQANMTAIGELNEQNVELRGDNKNLSDAISQVESND